MDKEVLDQIKLRNTYYFNTNIKPNYLCEDNITLKFDNVTIDNNILTSNNKSINLGVIILENLDASLFDNDLETIIYILENMSILANNPNFIISKAQRINNLTLLNSLTDEEINDIKKYVQDYFNKNNLKDFYNYHNLNHEIEYLRVPIDVAYDNMSVDNKYNKPACILIREELDKLHVWQENLDNSSSKSNAVVRVNTKEGYTYVKSDTNRHFNVYGFANTALIVSITVSIGITLSILAIFLANK